MNEHRDTRRILLDASAAEFALNGLDGTRMQAIVKRAGVNERMVYHHFGSKQGLYEAVLVNQRESVSRHVSAADVTGEPREAFGLAMKQIMRALIERPFFLSLMLHEALGGWRHSPAVALSEVPKSLTGLFKRAQKEGAFRNDIRFESVYLAALGALTAGYLLSGRFEVMRDNEKRRDQLIDEVLELVLRGAAPCRRMC
jgi:AcrR family transcriptional regulator